MFGSNDQVWVTSALSDDHVERALLLCYSLRKTRTSRPIAVIASPKISPELRNALSFEFDFVFYLPEDQNSTQLKPGDFAKLYSVMALRSFTNCAYLSPWMFAVKNCDDIFDVKTDGLAFLEDDPKADVFLFKPSFHHFKAMEEGMKNICVNGCGIGSYLKKWAKNQFKNVKTLDGKFNKILIPGKQLLGYESDISLVNLENYPKETDMATLQNMGILNDLVLVHWLKIREENVSPLIQLSLKGICPMINENSLASRYSKEPIAIVGISCRFPGSNNLEEFWNLLFEGQDGTCTPPPFRWVREQCSRQMAHARKTNAGFLKVPMDEFDSRFFGISPKEVVFMDPQHRLMHELIWEGLEDACIDPHTLRGTPGSIFMGSWTNDYKDILVHSGNKEFYRGYMGNSIGAATARLSFLLGLTGPSIATESGCSSAMVAVHLACRSLQNGKTNLAMAGGVNLLLHPFDKDEMPLIISPDGQCKTFSADANGFARAEGCGVLVLKRLSDAIRDNDNIWALIRGTAVAQEGVSPSMGTPTVHCEALAMKNALKDAGVRPEEVSYVEAHGTGTAVGDPMEVAAIAKAYQCPSRRDPLIIGSVKTNVGHTESCSGITGMMKVVLALHNEVIPAHRNFTELNQSIDLEAIPAIIPIERLEWEKSTENIRIAGVSSFGITGTDAHAIIEESPEIGSTKALTVGNAIDRPLHILKISAKTDEALEILLSKYWNSIKASKENLADICYSTNVGRANFNHGAVILAKNKDDAIVSIEHQKYLKSEVNADTINKICFLFTGQGSQYPGMAKMLYDSSPVFQMYFDFCESILYEKYNISLKTILWSENQDSTEIVNRTIYSQTSIFCVEYALLKLWESWGVKPDYALGHSLGEFAAAVCAGIISVEDAITLVAERSRLIDELPRGKMLVIQADYNEVENLMKKFAGGDAKKLLDYAAINSSEQTVVAGDSDVIMEFAKFCTGNQFKCTVLAATHAFHSKHMDPMLNSYRSIAKAALKFTPSQKCEYISGMNGDLIAMEKVDAEYWVHHTREKVCFLNASKKATELGCNIFIEIGPQPVLSALTMMNNGTKLLCLPSLKRKHDDWRTILDSLGKLYMKGVDIDWKGIDQFYNRKKVHSLPLYPFIGKKFWPDMMQATGNAIHPLIGSLLPNASSIKIFESRVNISAHEYEYIKDHAIGKTVIFPGAGYLEMSLAAGLATVEGSIDSLGKPSRPMKVENLMIKAPLSLDESKSCQLQTVAQLNTLKENHYDWNDVSVKTFHHLESDSASSWIEHAVSTFSPLPTAEEQMITFNVKEFQEILSKASNEEIIFQAYDKLASIGLKFGEAFRSLEKVWRDEENGKLLAKVKVPEFNDGQYIIHPVVLDAMIQAIMMMRITTKLKSKLYVPIKIGKFIWLSNGTSSESDKYIHVYENSGDDGNSGISASINPTALLIDSNGKVMAMMTNVEFIDTTVKAIESILEQQTSTMPDLWEETWRPKMGPSQNRFDLSLCRKDNIFDENFVNSMEQKFNKPSVELANIIQNLESLVYYNFLRCLYQCGWKPTLDEVIYEDDLGKQLGIQNEYSKMFGYMLCVLEEEGILEKNEGEGSSTWRVVGIPPSLKNVQEQLSSTKLSNGLIEAFNPTLLLTKLGENYSEIVKGTKSALPILFPEDGGKTNSPAVEDFYTGYGQLLGLSEMCKEALSIGMQHFKGNDCEGTFRILEVGAGTGFYTKSFLDCLEQMNVNFEYTYTDISPAFFAAAEKKFEAHLKNMTFKKLNIEEDPISQGFTPNYYDWIVASDVIHATKNVKEALMNVGMLLKPAGGKFDMLEQTRICRVITYIFGLLDGFWRFEDMDLRPNHCTLYKDKWTEALGLAGFDVLKIFSCTDNRHSLILSYKSKDSSVVYQQIRKMSKEQKSRYWILFEQGDSTMSKALCQQISTIPNRQVIIVRKGEKFSSNDWGIVINPECEQDFGKLFDVVENLEESTIEGVLYCWSLDKTCTSQDSVLRPYFNVVKSLLGLKQTPLPKLISLLDGVMPVEDNDLSHFHPSTIWGFTKALKNERMDLNCRCIDIGGNQSMDGVEQVFYELFSPDKETQVAFHDTSRYVCKIQPLKPALQDLKLPSGTDRFQLILPETKAIADLQFGSLEPFSLGENEIEVQVKSSALNFRDVFSVLKPSNEFKDCNAVGFDFAGVVKRVGSEVSLWSVGDHVFGVNINEEALPSHIKLNENDVLPIPPGMTPCDACTLPAVVETSYHCIVEVANVTAADTVLIHTASGGVGLSAIQICKNIGARIIATAGSKRKQNYLRSLGIQHVFHSRSTRYGKEILRVTKGRGVDVVLNSLTSEGFKEASLKVCAIGARFVEMSKLSIWKPEEVKKLRPDVQYTVVDLASMDKSEWRRLMKEVRKLSEKQVISPIPYVRFDAVHIREALQYIQKAKHIGKVVCVMPEVKQYKGQQEVTTPIFNENATYLITGGLGGIGFVVCRWMVGKGAKHVIVAGRRIPDEAMHQSIDSLNNEYGSKVKAVQLDVGDFEQCAELIQAKISQMGYPCLRGVMHAAGTLSDGLIENHSWETVSSTFNAKVNGTINLHQLTKNLNLEHFVLFSSMASIFGSPGQCNHSAANNFEDAVAHYRNSVGLPATTVNWGQWGEVGIATEVDLPGVKSISNLQGTTGLEYALKSQRTQTVLINIESFVLMAKLFPHISSILDERVWSKGGIGPSSGIMHMKSDEFWQQYDSQQNVDEKRKWLKDILKSILRNILRLDDVDIIDDNSNFQEIGVDSLMFVEIKNAVQSLFGDRVAVNASAMRDCNSIELLTDALLKVIEGGKIEEEIIPTQEEVAQLIKEDCQLSQQIMSRPEQEKVHVSDISTVLLTGCTGNLGPYILKELTNMSQVTQVVCLIRPVKNVSGESRLRNILQERCLLSEVDMRKIRCVDGNVATPNLGLEPIMWEDMCNNVDAIFHCAARVDHTEYYRKRESEKDTRAVNVGGTKNILEFACTGGKLKHIYCASSLLAVATVDGEDGSLSENWPEANDYDGVTTVSYPTTKFVGDMLMKQAILERGIPGKVFRFPLIAGDSKTGRFVLDNNHVMLRYLFMLKQGVMPSTPIPAIVLPVDICAWASVKIFFNPDAPDDVYNASNCNPEIEQRFVGVAERLGYKVETVEFSEFSEKIRQSVTKDSPFALFKDFYRNDKDILSLFSTTPALKQWVLEAGTGKNFTVSKKIRKILPEFYNGCCPCMEWIYRDLLFAKNQGWFEKFKL